jgi:hypothetical protein
MNSVPFLFGERRIASAIDTATMPLKLAAATAFVA